jgi:hypothetical protein
LAYYLTQLRPLLQKHRAKFDDGSGTEVEAAFAKFCVERLSHMVILFLRFMHYVAIRRCNNV